jgi:hypothetical protein
LLDSAQHVIPYYHLELKRELDGNIATWSDHDSPATGAPPNGANTAFIDSRVEFELFLVCRYSDGSMYPVANTTWSVNFYSSFNQVLAANGVQWSEQSNYDNTLPDKLRDPIANGNIAWV